MLENKRIIEENAANGITLEDLVQDAQLRGDDYMPVDKGAEIDRRINAVTQKMESSSLTKEFKKVLIFKSNTRTDINFDETLITRITQIYVKEFFFFVHLFMVILFYR